VLETQDLPEAERRAFADWLRKSPAHVAEYLMLTGIRAQLRDCDIPEARSISNVESFPILSPLRGAGRGAGVLSRSRIAFFSLAASTLIAISVWLAWPESHVLYTTAIGEQRSVLLPDGSIAELNTRSSLNVKYDAAAREVTLSEGEALFRVAKDSQRPFRVRSGSAVIQAIGTRFNVRHDRERTVVTVLEGRVAVNDAELIAGQRVAIGTASVARSPRIEKANTAAVIAWQSRRLVFDAAPLTEVVAEFNRYNEQEILIKDPDAARRRITGVFNANDPASLVSFLRSEAVAVNAGEDGALLIR
jgi:transmembrane sensor